MTVFLYEMRSKTSWMTTVLTGTYYLIVRSIAPAYMVLNKKNYMDYIIINWTAKHTAIWRNQKSIQGWPSIY